MSRPTKRTATQLAYTAIRIEGGLIPAEELTRLTALAAPEATEQTEAYYDIPKGLKLRDEIARHFKTCGAILGGFAVAPAERGLEKLSLYAF